MLISCPKCSAVYKVSENQIPNEGKRFKCAECGKIWTAHPEDLKDLEPETGQVKSQIIRNAAAYDSDEADIQDMFLRISQDTKGLFNDTSTRSGRFHRIIRKIQVFFSPMMLNCTLLTLIFGLTYYIGYVNRYELVGLIPRLEGFYDKINLESIYNGRDLKFTNVVIRNIEKQGKHFVEISGILQNEGKLKTQIPPIKAVMSTLDGNIEAETMKILPIKSLQADFGAMFRIVLDNKTTEAKRVALSFDGEYYANLRKAELEAEKARKEEEAKNKKANKSFDFGFNKGMDNF